MAKISKKIVIIGITLAISVFILNLLVNNLYTHRLIRAIIYEKFSQHSELNLEFEALSISIVPLDLTMYGLQLGTNSKFKTESLLQVSMLEVHLSLWDLFIGNKKISKITAQDLKLNWPPPWDFKGFLKNQNQNLDQQELTWPPAPLPIDELVLRNARFIGYFPLKEEVPHKLEFISTTLEGLDLRVKLNQWDRVDVDLVSAKSKVFYGNEQITQNARISSELTLEGNEITSEFMSIQSPNLDLKGNITGKIHTNGTDQKVNKIQLSNTWQGDVDLNILGTMLEIPNTSGRVSGSYYLDTVLPISTGEAPSIDISGEVQSHGSMIDDFKLFDSKVKFNVEQERINFEHIDIIIAGRKYGETSGFLGFGDTIPFSFDGSLKKLPLSKLLSVFDIPFDSFNFDLSSDLVKIKGKGSPFSMSVNAKSQLNRFDFEALPKQKTFRPISPECLLNLNLKISGKGMWVKENQGRCYDPKAYSKTNQEELPTELPAKNSIEIGGVFYFDDTKGMDLAIKSPDLSLDLVSYFGQIPISGRAELETRIFGPYDRITISNLIESTRVNILKIPLGKVAGKVEFNEKNILSWTQLSIRPDSGGQILFPSGGLNPKSLELLPSKIRAINIDQAVVDPLVRAIEPKTSLSFGLKNLKGSWRGPITKPLSGGIDADFSLNNLGYENERIADNVGGRLLVNSKQVKLEKAVLQIGDTQLGSFLEIKKAKKNPVLKESSFFWSSLGFSKEDLVSIQTKTIRSSNRSLLDLQKIPYFGENLRAIELEGLLELNAEVQGTMEKVQGSLEAKLDQLKVFNSPLAPVNIQGVIDGSKLQLNLNHSGNTLEGRITTDLADERLAFDWYLQFRRTDIRALTTKYFFQDPRNYAYLTGYWTLKGHFKDWWQAKGELYIEQLRTKFNHDIEGKTQNITLSNEVPAKILFADSGWTYQENIPLKLSGDYIETVFYLNNSHPPSFLNLSFESIIQGKVFEVLSKHVESATGSIAVNGELKGPVQDLKLSAKIFSQKSAADEQLSIGFPSVRPEFKNIDFLCTYKDGMLFIDHLNANKGLGELNANGYVVLDNNSKRESNLNISFDQIRVVYPVPYIKNFDTVLSGAIQLSGEKAPYLLAGDVRIEKARSTRKVDLIKEVVNVLRQESLVDETEGALADPILKLNVNILADKSIVIHNNNIQATISSDLRLEGSELKQILLGRMDINSGKFIYKREFNIERGEIIFDDPIKVNPKIDIVAITDVSPYTVTVAVTETASNPVVELIVDPPTRDDGSVITRLESIVLLSTGSLPKTETKTAEAQGVGISEILNVVGSQSKVPFEKFSEMFGENLIHVYPDVTIEDDGSPALQLNGDVKITENVEAGFKYIPGSNKYKAAIEVPVNRNISLTGGIEQDVSGTENNEEGVENTSVDLRFRFSIK